MARLGTSNSSNLALAQAEPFQQRFTIVLNFFNKIFRRTMQSLGQQKQILRLCFVNIFLPLLVLL
jgi:hypothetical protein